MLVIQNREICSISYQASLDDFAIDRGPGEAFRSPSKVRMLS